MTNAEKYKDAIITQMCETGDWAVNKNTGEIVGCYEHPCSKCLFYNGCSIVKAKWLNAEHREPKEFTDDERKLMKLLDKAEWVARDYDDTLWAFFKKPHKEVHGRWASYSGQFCINTTSSLSFSAITSMDIEPTSRAEILGEEK